MNDASGDRARRMALTALCALGVHALVLLAVRMETPRPTPMPAEAGIEVVLDALPPEEPPVVPPERVGEPTPPEPERVEMPPPEIVPAEPVVERVERKLKPKHKPKPKPRVPKPSVPVVPLASPSREAPKAEEFPVVGPAIRTPLTNRKPVYPELARRRGQQGRVLLLAAIDESGVLTDLAVQESSGYSMLDEAALKAVRRWRFSPATRAGASRKGTLLIPVTFTLRK